MRSGIRVAAVTGIAALATAGAAACAAAGASRTGPTGGSAAAGGTVLAAYRATTNAKTASFRLDETVQAASAGGSSQRVTITGAGQVDFAARAFAVSFDAPSGGAIKILQVPGAARAQIPGASRGSA